MIIRAEHFDFLSNLDTLTAVVAGAVLATAGGFIGSQIEHRVDVRRRERNAALFFGEIMSLLSVSVAAAQRARGIGDPFGPVTMRILRTIRRELDIYERNRERLFELSDPTLRARIHTTLLRTTMGVEGALESASEASDIQTEFQMSPDMSSARREHLDANSRSVCACATAASTFWSKPLSKPRDWRRNWSRSPRSISKSWCKQHATREARQSPIKP